MAIAASASAAPTDVDRYLLAARGFYERLEYERALEQLNRAKTLPRGPDQDATISLYEGILQCELNRPEDAANAFRAALYLRPDSQLPVKVSPKVQEAFEQTRQEVTRELAKALPPAGTKKADATPPLTQTVEAPTVARPRQYRLSLLLGTFDLVSVGATGSVRIADRWSVGGEAFLHVANANDFIYLTVQGRFFPLGSYDHGGFVALETGLDTLTQNATEIHSTVFIVGTVIGYRVSSDAGLTFEASGGLDLATGGNVLLPVVTLAVGWSMLRK